MLVQHHPLIDDILAKWRGRIGADFAGYRGHVYRVFNFALALHPCDTTAQDKLAVAACFHDIGLWSEATLDYLSPSVAQAQDYLSAHGQQDWIEQISLMIEWHHKVRPYEGSGSPLVEVFRRADLVDFSLGLIRSGLSREQVQAVKTCFPNAGFHRFLLKGARQWFLSHPLRIPPFVRW